MKPFAIVLTLLSYLLTLSAQTVEGRWKTVDEKTGKAESTVEMYIQKGKLYGKIIKLYGINEGDEGYCCSNCSGERKNQKIEGMVIIEGLEKNDDKWEGNNAVFYPAHDRSYDCKIWLDDKNKNVLYVKGSWGFIYRTQKWYRIK